MLWNYKKYISAFCWCVAGSHVCAELVEVSLTDFENGIDQIQTNGNSCSAQLTPNNIADKPVETLEQNSKAKSFNKNNVSVGSSNKPFRTERTPEDDNNYPIKNFVSAVQSTDIQTLGDSKTAVQDNLSIYAEETLTVHTFDEVGKLLAGLSDKWNGSAFYRSYSDYIAKSWSKLEANCFRKIRSWRDKNLSESVSHAKTIFYPFGGPDAAYAILLFPNAENYILVGQEKTGRCQSVLGTVFSESVLNNIKKSEKNFFEKGYFVTLEMLSDLNNSSLTGVLPIAMLTISKLGYEILDVANESPVSKDVGTVKIEFRDPRTKQKKNLYYVRCGLEDRSAHISELLAFVSSFGEFTTFFKSCSYKMHQKGFEKIKSFVLDNSSTILQDDTGIRFDKVDKNVFDYKLFGSYEKPSLDVFRNFRQASLAQAYSQAKPEPFDFCIGYIGDTNVRNKNYKNINLQLFSRKVLKDNGSNKVKDNKK